LTASAPAVAGVALDPQERRAQRRGGVLDRGDELAGVHGIDAVVVIGRGHEQRRVARALDDAVVRRVRV
jgi:hypothetical protein